MKKVIGLVVAAVMAIGLVGCDEGTATPMGVVTKAYSAIAQNDLNTFSDSLTGAAAAEYGNAVGMEKIKSKIGSNIVFFGESVLKKTELLNPLNGKRIYDLDIKGSEIDSEDGPGTILTAEVECEFTTLNDVPPSTSMLTTTKCKISAIK